MACNENEHIMDIRRLLGLLNREVYNNSLLEESIKAQEKVEEQLRGRISRLEMECSIHARRVKELEFFKEAHENELRDKLNQANQTIDFLNSRIRALNNSNPARPERPKYRVNLGLAKDKGASNMICHKCGATRRTPESPCLVCGD